MKPNILLITTDQQRHDTCGPLAPAFMRTPHFDILSREGITFSSAYADCPICVPARVGIMTGKSYFIHRMFGNGNTSDVMGRDRTLPAFLRELGYQTAAIGKMHFGPERARHGFDEMILPSDYYRQMMRSGLPFQPMRHGLGQNELYPSMATVPESMTLTSWIAEQCVEYIRFRRDPTVPFFLWCSFTKPHPPLDPPEPYYSMYRNCPIPKPVYGDWSADDKCPEPVKRFRQQWSTDLLSPEIIQEARSAYYGLITHCDYSIGRVLGALQDLSLLRDTLIIFTSDHGEYLGDHLLGGKFWYHEPSAHVPFVLRLPKCFDDRRAGSSVSIPVTHADILPTLIRAAGGEPPEDTDGIDLISLAREQLGIKKRYIYGGRRDESKAHYLAITDGSWKYIYYPEGGAEQLFDLENDPRELRDLAKLDDYSGKLSELRSEVIAWHSERNTGCVQEGKLPVEPIEKDSTLKRRNEFWPGLHTEYFDMDIRH